MQVRDENKAIWGDECRFASETKTGLMQRAGASTDGDRARLADALYRTGTGDREAFRNVYMLTTAKLFHICLLICGERAAAEDVLQDVYIKIWRNAGKWDPGGGSAISWLSAIARNQAIDWLRSQKNRNALPIDDAFEVVDPSPCAETALLSDERSRHLQQCIDSLDSRTRHAIFAAFFKDITHVELANRTGAPLGTIKSVIRRGLTKLRSQLQVR